MDKVIQWHIVLDSLHTLQPVEGGFTNARRGIVTLPDNAKLFIKIGIDPITNKWAQKEVDIYKTLMRHGYKYIPKLVSTSSDRTGFALEILDNEDGWQWETPWTEERLKMTLVAMDALAEVPTDTFKPKILNGDQGDVNVNPWLMPKSTSNSRKLLMDKLAEINMTELTSQLESLRKNFYFSPSDKRLVHYDVRRDNCAWNPSVGEVKLVDWNWLHLGSREIDINALLVNVFKSGLDPLINFSDRLSRDALLWLCGYWLSSSIEPGENSMSDHVSLRSYQFDSAIAAYKLASQLEASS